MARIWTPASSARATEQLVVPRSIPSVGFMLFDFDFRRGEDLDGHGRFHFGEVDAGGVPAFVAEGAALGLARGGDVTEEFDCGVVLGEGSGGFSFGVGALDAVDDGGEGNVAAEGLAGLLVEGTDGGTDLIVGIARDIFHEEIEEAGFALQEAENLEGSVAGLDDRDGGGFRFRFLFDRFDIAVSFGDFRREGAREEDPEER